MRMVAMANCSECKGELPANASFCPKCGASVQSGAVGAMIQDARQALSANPDDAAARYNLAIAHKLGGADQLALEELQRVTDLQPDFADAHYQKGILHAKAGRSGEARTALSRALELDPDHAQAKRLLERLPEAG